MLFAALDNLWNQNLFSIGPEITIANREPLLNQILLHLKIVPSIRLLSFLLYVCYTNMAPPGAALQINLKFHINRWKDTSIVQIFHYNYWA